MIDLTRHYLFDGGMGSMLQDGALRPGQNPEELNLTQPDTIAAIHRAYAEAGADVITANTFGASRWKLNRDPAPYIEAGIAIARRAAGTALIALDVGPLGAMLEPFGDMPFDTAYEMYQEVVETGTRAGADLILIETMSDLLEAKAALLAAKEHTALPVFVTMTFGKDGRTFLGTDPAAAALTFTSLGADAVGLNCSLGPEELFPALQAMLAVTPLPVLIQPNAGLPRWENGKTVYDVTPEEFARWAAIFLEAGASMLGGCCGTTPAHIRATAPLIKNRTPVVTKPDTALDTARYCGWQNNIELPLDGTVTVGELINPTGRQKLTAALRERDWDYVAELAIRQAQSGADFLVVNAGLPDIDETEALPAMVLAIQEVSALPLVLDCANPAALEKALRLYRGRPVINSVNGRRESLDAILPLAVKYGTGLVALSLDENGIPPDAASRHWVAMAVARAAEKAGVKKQDIWIDSLALTAAVNQEMVMVTPEAVRMAKAAGYRTVLGISNISFGLPKRDAVNGAFLALCMAAGLNVAILNTTSPCMTAALDAMRVLTGQDKSCQRYIARYAKTAASAPGGSSPTNRISLEEAITGGLKEEAARETNALLAREAPLEILNRRILPALDAVGASYESGETFLPQLMASAAAVKAAFGELERVLPPGEGDKGTVVLATVKGDIHDIGKNLVGMLLENYGYRVIDLGRDVPPEVIVEAVRTTGAPLVGLSALMTTTAQNIPVTVRALRDAGLSCRIMVGGAVITQAFVDQCGADYYAKDAAQSANIAAEVFGRVQGHNARTERSGTISSKAVQPETAQ